MTGRDVKMEFDPSFDIVPTTDPSDKEIEKYFDTLRKGDVK